MTDDYLTPDGTVWRPWMQSRIWSDLRCASIIRQFGTRNGLKLKPMGVDGENEERVAMGRWFTNQKMRDDIERHFQTYKHTMTSIQWDGFEQFNIVRYGPGGKYDWHADNEMLPGDSRKLTAVIALSGDFNGGGLDFMWPNPATIHHVKPHVGEAVVFPSTLFHRGAEVISGERWILVAWGIGRQYR